MLSKFAKKRLVIDIKNREIIFCVGSFDGTEVKVDKVFRKILDYDIYSKSKINDENLLASSIKEVLKENNVKEKNCYTYIIGSDIIRKTLIVPYLEDKNDFNDIIHTEISQVLPIDMDNFIVKYKIFDEINNENMKQVKINCAVIDKEVVASYKRVLKLAGLKPVSLDMDTSALENLVKYIIMSNSDDIGAIRKEVDNSIIAFADINVFNCSISIFKGGKLDFTRIIKTPAMSDSVIKDLSEIKNINDIKDEETFEAINEIISEINMVFKYYSSRNRNAVINEVFLYGVCAMLEDFDKYCLDILQMNVNSIDNINGIIDTEKNIPIFISSIGGLIRW